MKTIVGQSMRGLLVPVKGLSLIFGSPKTLGLSLLPFCIGFLALFFGIFWAASHLGFWVDSFLQKFLVASGTLFSLLSPVLSFLAWAGFLVSGFVLMYVLISIIAGPFLSLLAEHVYKLRSYKPVQKGTLGLVARMFILSLVKAVFFLFIGAISLVLWFFPPLNIFGTFLVFLTVAFDCMDYVFEVDFLTMRERFRFFFDHIWIFVGLSGAVFATSMLPGLFFLLLPAFVAGSTHLYVELRSEK